MKGFIFTILKRFIIYKIAPFHPKVEILAPFSIFLIFWHIFTLVLFWHHIIKSKFHSELVKAYQRFYFWCLHLVFQCFILFYIFHSDYPKNVWLKTTPLKTIYKFSYIFFKKFICLFEPSVSFIWHKTSPLVILWVIPLILYYYYLNIFLVIK